MKNAVTVSLGLVVAAAMYLAASGYTYAQDNNQRGRRGGEGMRQGGPGGGWDPAQMREMMAQRMKGMLGCSDEEWEVIGPRFEKVMELQMRSRMGGMMGPRGPRRGGSSDSNAGNAGGPGGPGGPGMGRGGSEEAQALQAALADEDSTPETIKAKLEALRDAKKKQEAELAKARESLREVLSLRQEAQLVLMGTLD